MEDGHKRKRDIDDDGVSVVVPDLPISIISDILSRLPVEDVARYRCVCKGWDNLSKDPHFTYLHFTTSSEMFRHQRLNILLLEGNADVMYKYKKYLGSGDLYLISRREEDGMWKTTNISPEKHIRGVVLASCNGLLCTNARSIYTNTRSIYTNTRSIYSWGPNVVYNPLTKDHISLPELEFQPHYNYFDGYDCGLGFDSNNKKYKIALAYESARYHADGCQQFTNIMTGAIITLGESSWRTLQFPVEFESCIYSKEPLFFNESFHWVIGRQNHLDGILVLDISSEKFEIIKFSNPLVLPAPPFLYPADRYLYPVQLENSIAFFRSKKPYSTEDFSLEIWQILGANTDGSCLYNHKTFTVSRPSFGNFHPSRLLGALGNGVFIFQDTERPLIYGYLIIYDPEKDQDSVIEILKTPKYFKSWMFTPSLISPS